MKEIIKGIYEVKLPLEGSSLRELSSYIITGQESSCILDVGFATQECDGILRDAVKQLGLDRRKTDIILTHTHEDHWQNLPNMYQDFGTVICSEWDKRQITEVTEAMEWEQLRVSFKRCGIPAGLLEQVPDEWKEKRLIPKEKIRIVSEGDILRYGDFNFQVLDLKGHMPGMIGLYDEEKGLLFPGDHVLNRITPNIGFYEEKDCSLKNYLENLRKVRDLPAAHVFPAHRGEVKDLSARVDEILEHHEERLDEISGILYNKPMCAYDVAGKVKWYYREGNFMAYPVLMKWMASSEILAHLEYLYERGELERMGREGETFIFRWKQMP